MIPRSVRTCIREGKSRGMVCGGLLFCELVSGWLVGGGVVGGGVVDGEIFYLRIESSEVVYSRMLVA